ncbi:MAG: S8 family serine peptidase, partial [Ilumatobacteraceae bacterium]
QRTDYRVEVYQPTSRFAAGGLHTNPSMPLPVDLWPQIPGTQNVVDANQRGGAPPLEMADQFWCTNSGISYLRIVPNPATPIGSVPDVLEIASTNRDLEYDSDPHGSAAKPVVDSANHNLVAVGALASPNANDVAYYSSQGPTTDGRIKPDLVAPSCVTSTVYAPGCFAGTSAASPAAAGVAALIRSAGLAANGESLVALVMHFTADLLAPGRDNASGAGKISLPPPPVPSTPGDAAQYNVVVPTRLLDTRVSSPVGPPNLIGPQPERGILDLPVTGSNSVPAAGVSAVALNITSVDSLTTNFVQALPTMQGVVGATSTLNVAVTGAPRPNFAIVPVGQDGRITLYMPAGGNVVVDLLGYFSPPSSVPPSAVPPSAGPGSASPVSASPVSASPVSAGRFVSLRPERWIDSRDPAVLPPELTAPRLVAGGETITVSRLPTTAVPATGVAALVVNVTSDGATLAGYLRAQPTGSSGLSNSTVNYVAGVPAANTSIVGLGDGSTISVYALRPTNVIVDVVGYITSNDAPQSSAGLFIALTPGRNFDSRSGAPFADGSTHVIGLTQLGSPATLVPADACAVSANLTAVQGASVGFVTVWADGSRPATSSLNFTANDPVANGTLMQLAADGSVSVFVNRQAHVIIDVNGYFTGPR